MVLRNNKLLGLALTTALTSVAFTVHAQQAFTDFSVISSDVAFDDAFTVTTPDANTTIGNQVGQRTTIGTPNSSIGLNETVKILQDTTTSTLVVYAQNGSDPTRILGNLFTRLKDGDGNETAALGGNVFIKDGDGIITGANSVIDANSVILTTGDIAFNADNKVELSNFGVDSRVILNGAITVAEGGLAAFVAPTVVNNGIITANAGRIELAGANTLTTVDLYGDGLLEIAIDETNTENLVARNNGELFAAGGIIHMTAGAAEDLVNSTVNLSGIARADSATQIGGKIILGGKNTGRVRIDNKAQARGETGGGEIHVEAENVTLTENAILNVRAFENGNGGKIDLFARNNAILNNRLRAMGGANGGDGGTITTSAVNALVFGSDLEVMAQAFAEDGVSGSWIIDPVNLNIVQATADIFATTLNNGTSIDASATNNVLLNGDVTWTGGANFELSAGNILRLNNSINGDGNVTLTGTNLVDLNVDITAAMIDIKGATANLNGDLNAATVKGNVSTVNVESNMAKIQDGVDIAALGGTVNVSAGQFNENINVNKSVTLRGAQAGIDARNRTGVNETEINPNSPAFNVTADNVVIDGFDVNGGNPGIQVVGADNVQLLNNIVRNQSAPGSSDDGVLLNNATNVTIRQNWIKNNGDEGIFGRNNLNNLLVQNNLIEDVVNNAIEVFRGSGTITIDDNVINRAGLNGVFVNDTDSVKVTNNKINNNAGTDNGIRVRSSDSVMLIDNEIDGGPVGIEIDGGMGNVVDDNDVENFTDTGIIVTNGATGTDVTDNFIQTLVADTVGVLVENSNDTTVGGIGNALRNRIFDVNTAVEVNGGTNTQVIGNDIRRANVGVLADTAGSLNVYKNMIDGAATGVDIVFSDGAKIVDNMIKNTGIGVFIEEGENVLIDDNDITNFSDAGVVIERTVNADVINNLIQSTQKDAIGVDVIDGTGAQIGGDGNTLRNRIFDVDTGVQLSGDSFTTIDGNDFRRTQTGILATDTSLDGTRFISTDLKITDNTFDNGFHAIDLDSAQRVLVGGDGDRNTINNFNTGVKVVGGYDVNVDNNQIRNVNFGIYADYVGQLNIEDNNLDARYFRRGKGTTGIFVGNSFNAQIGGEKDGNFVEDFATGIQIVNSFSADVEHNNVEESTLDAINVSKSRYIDVKDNILDDNTGNGINVSWSSDAEINDNRLHDTGKEGIILTGGSRGDIKGNHVHHVGGNGINVSGNAFVEINDDNEVYNTGKNGIKVSDSFDATIAWNDVRYTGDDGIDVTRSLVADINNNYIENAGDDGIDVENTGLFFGKGVDINDNTINGAKEDGINVYKVAAVDVIDNTIYKAGRDGINVSWSPYADIKDNKILGTRGGFFRNGTNGAGRDGIHVEDSAYVDITNNQVRAGGNGFFSFGGKGASQFGIYSDDTYAVNVIDNKILGTAFGNQGSGSDAIRLEDSAFADIEENNIFNVGGDAVHVKRSFAVDVIGNTARFTGDDGIDVEFSNNANIQSNTIFATKNNGIEVEFSDFADIGFESIDSGGEGSELLTLSSSKEIERNQVAFAGLNGIYVEGGQEVDIFNNDVRDVNNNGIEVNNTTDALIGSNDVTNSDAAGVLVNGAFGTEVSGNTLIGNDIGVEVFGFEEEFINSPSDEEFEQFQTAFLVRAPRGAPSDDTLILNNVIEDSDTAGIQTSGNAVGAVEITENQLDNNTIGFLLEGGEIDISSLLQPNTINGGETGMRFIGEDVSLANNTLGSTIFSNQMVGNALGNYVELVDGALFNPGTPTIIDGLAASFDGVVPLDSPLGAGILTAVQRQAIEDRLIDFDDNNTLGQIIVGLGFDLSQEDVFALNLFSLSPDAQNVNITFNGLPRTSPLSIAELTNIETASGGEASVEDLANTEPASGESEGCWASVAETGFDGTVSFSFGADAISDEACAN